MHERVKGHINTEVAVYARININMLDITLINII